MTPANTCTASNVFAGMLLCGGNYTVLNEVAVSVPLPEACELLEYAA